MHLSLVISLDLVADSFEEQVAAHVASWPGRRPANQETLWYKSTDWLGPEPLDVGASLEHLGADILSKLNNRKVDSVEISLVLYAQDSEPTDLFLPLHSYFEQFLRVATTRRIYVIYPRQAKALKEFQQKFNKLMAEAANAKDRLSETNLMIMPQEASGRLTQWPKHQVQAYAMVNFMDQCRIRLDEFLVGHGRSTTSCAYSRCVFCEDLWRRYFVLRSKQDLSDRRLIEQDTALDARTVDSIKRLALVSANYNVEPDQKLMERVAIKSRIEVDNANDPARRSYERLLGQQNEDHAKLLDAEKPHFDRLRETYRNILIELLDEDQASLAGFEGALYFHQRVLGAINNPCSHEPFLTELIQKDLISVVNHLIEGIRILLGPANVTGCRLENVTGPLCDRDIGKQLENIEDLLRSLSWKAEKLCIRSAFSKVLYQVGKIFQYVSALSGDNTNEAGEAEIRCSFVELITDRIINNELRLALKKSFEDMDKELSKLKQEHRDREKSLDELAAEYSLFKKMLHVFSYRERKRIILKQVAAINRRYREWGTSVNVYISAIESFLAFCGRLKLILELFLERREVIEETGSYLVQFDKASREIFESISQEVDRIPEGPVEREGFELSFLSKSNMEQLYSEFGEAKTKDYMESLLQGCAQSWGKWAVGNIRAYLMHLQPYCERRFECVVPPLDLSKLMFVYFPDFVDPRVRQLVEIASRQLIPLTEANLDERWHHMMFGFPQDSIAQLTVYEPSLIHRDMSVSTNPTPVIYVANDDPMALDLTLSLCGFRLEDYLFIGVFETPDQEQ